VPPTPAPRTAGAVRPGDTMSFSTAHPDPDLGVASIASSLARAQQQIARRQPQGENVSFWEMRVTTLTAALKRAQQQLRAQMRDHLARDRALGRLARRTGQRQRGAGRPGVRRVARASSSSDPPGQDGEHHHRGLTATREASR
jgi:hypothetical protein